MTADEVAVSLVVRMDRDRAVAQHRLGPGRRHRDEASGLLLDRIAEVPEAAALLDRHDLDVGDRRQQRGVPVDEPLVAVDEAFPVQRHEGLEHGRAQPIVHGEAGAGPVTGGAESLELADDLAAGFRLPGPDAFHKGLAAHGAPARLLPLHQLAFDHHLGGDAGMVHAGLPEYVAPTHPPEPAQHILQSVIERMPDVQGPGHIGRRDHHRIGHRAAPLGAAGPEGLGPLPHVPHTGFDRGWLERLVHHRLQQL